MCLRTDSIIILTIVFFFSLQSKYISNFLNKSLTSDRLFVYCKQSVAKLFPYGDFRTQSRRPDHQHSETVFLVTRRTYKRSFIVLFVRLFSVYGGNIEDQNIFINYNLSLNHLIVFIIREPFILRNELNTSMTLCNLRVFDLKFSYKIYIK